jgi:hypothetical protein
MKPVRVPGTANAITRQIVANLATQARPELAGVRIVRRFEDLGGLNIPRLNEVYLRYLLGEAVTDQPG